LLPIDRHVHRRWRTSTTQSGGPMPELHVVLPSGERFEGELVEPSIVVAAD
jgi:hypothetical protein